MLIIWKWRHLIYKVWREIWVFVVIGGRLRKKIFNTLFLKLDTKAVYCNKKKHTVRPVEVFCTTWLNEKYLLWSKLTDFDKMIVNHTLRATVLQGIKLNSAQSRVVSDDFSTLSVWTRKRMFSFHCKEWHGELCGGGGKNLCPVSNQTSGIQPKWFVLPAEQPWFSLLHNLK